MRDWSASSEAAEEQFPWRCESFISSRVHQTLHELWAPCKWTQRKLGRGKGRITCSKSSFYAVRVELRRKYSANREGMKIENFCYTVTVTISPHDKSASFSEFFVLVRIGSKHTECLQGNLGAAYYSRMTLNEVRLTFCQIAETMDQYVATAYHCYQRWFHEEENARTTESGKALATGEKANQRIRKTLPTDRNTLVEQI
ncbi:hypothetical protein CEXT_704221 [Caerostris extrusa]|uniref:Uncharacterized protein n=1 Tax=Caerostris extrusa TaxID=172846 RepID=A0AAV4XB90_CAEEX|nr:hypothetical protein CEXT_704221 [Caerostris extrusa]